MRKFNYKNEYAKLLTPDIVNVLTVIHEFKELTGFRRYFISRS